MRFRRILRAHLPELTERYKVKSLGIFGSYLRAEQKPRSDLDVLVEYSEPVSLYHGVRLQDHLTELLGVKVDLVPKKNLKPYIGKRILSEVVWLQKDGVLTNARMTRRADGLRSRTMAEPKREYLDFLQDMVNAMERAERYVSGLNFDQFIQDEKTIEATTKAVEVIGEAAKQIPLDVKRRYPDIPWKDIAGMRDNLVHGYFAIDYLELWNAASIDIPKDKPHLARVLEEEKRRRGIAE